MLTLPIKKKWFDMILSGEKKEEYRDRREYYDTRFMNHFGFIIVGGKMFNQVLPEELKKDEKQPIIFRNGYSSTSPSFTAICSLREGTGKPEWGAEPGKTYYVLTIHEIIKQEVRNSGNYGLLTNHR